MLLALLRKAGAAYALSIRAELDAAGLDDLPKNGVFVLVSLARSAAPFRQIIGDLGVSKQAAGQLVDTLVQRGYLKREPDEHDRRRLNLSLGERGEAGASVVLSAIARIERTVSAQVGEDCIKEAERALAALITATALQPQVPADQGPTT